jgi:hypothetical protein
LALTPLAEAADLAARRVDIDTDPEAVAAALAAASAAVREAAGGATISRHTGTVRFEGSMDQWLTPPGWAVTAVADVAIDGTPVSDYRLIGGRLWRAGGWQNGWGPSEVSMTVTQGVTAVPADIVDLVCSLAAASLNAATEDGYDSHRGLAYERIDDYQRGFRQGDDEIVSPVELPAGTRNWLRQRFGGAATVTETH